MYKIHPLRDMAHRSGGEYVLGMKDLKTRACYLIYGELAPGEDGRRVCPGAGHEEILMAVLGDLQLNDSGEEFTLRQGEAVHFKEEEAVFLANPGQRMAIYVLAGGHSGTGH